MLYTLDIVKGKRPRARSETRLPPCVATRSSLLVSLSKRLMLTSSK